MNMKYLPSSTLWKGALFLFVLSVIAIHATTTLQIGLISDDYDLIAHAKEGKNLWSLHFSPFLTFLWKQTQLGTFPVFAWKLLVITFHLLNVYLVYLIAKIGLKVSLPAAILASALYATSPISMEALTWTCCAGYVLSGTWIFLTLILYERIQNLSGFLSGTLFVILQILAILTWDWGIFLFPVLGLYALTNKKSLSPLIPVSVVWSLISVWRIFSPYQTGWHENNLTTVVYNLLGAPVLGFLPQMDKTFFFSIPGYLITGIIWSLLLFGSWKNRKAASLLIAFILFTALWAIRGNPSSRYFYVPMAFLDLVLVTAIDQIPWRKGAIIGLIFFVGLQWIWMEERAQLWKMAYQESIHLSDQIALVTLRHPEKEITIVNLPESYGPPSLPLRAQFWFGGLDTLFPNIHVVKTIGSPFHWEKRQGLLTREEIKNIYKEQPIYEVVHTHHHDWRSFSFCFIRDCYPCNNNTPNWTHF